MSAGIKGTVGKALRWAGGASASIGVAGFGAALAVLCLAMWLLVPSMVRGAAGYGDGTSLFVIWPWLIRVVPLEGVAFAAWVVVVAAGILACIAWLVAGERRRIARDVRGFFARGGAARVPRSALGGVLLAFLAVGAFDFAYAAFLALAGGDLGDPLADVHEFWRVSYLLANASLWEEVVGRVMLIGLPLMLLDLWRGGRRPAMRLLGGYARLDAAFWVLAAYSSILFGVAHASGWTWWKVPPTLFAGLFFAWLYGRYGFHAAVALHFAFDFLSIPLLYFEDKAVSAGTYLMLAGYLAFAGCIAAAVVGIVAGLVFRWLDDGPRPQKGKGS